ncbi:hypothetical protein BDZ97DRAFT_1757645 [Flammula alnicola]|nr:hypothetical protein BDZ97DRAFT_1757645 [Flammula alnicola]
MITRHRHGQCDTDQVSRKRAKGRAREEVQVLATPDPHTDTMATILMIDVERGKFSTRRGRGQYQGLGGTSWSGRQEVPMCPDEPEQTCFTNKDRNETRHKYVTVPHFGVGIRLGNGDGNGGSIARFQVAQRTTYAGRLEVVHTDPSAPVEYMNDVAHFKFYIVVVGDVTTRRHSLPSRTRAVGQ